ncbi:phosphoglucosamine mutase [Thiomicrorhabdus xiamenensis]|uniref:Phosphoglucosamine mutase n=1 Tax=Thiomicrorhabdus xiamenensis TaxID=2739063 RepID=A0A7D4TDT5_9GAMM|nr:phosphoglucosamine mutase [Thiomicrorhabdus xiamenensis]QKI88867.1 phosphoglucosamine mutase [Thiomicrorhabdus xiamenensis]
MAKSSVFGTDGIRGTVGQGMINPDKVLQLGWAAGTVLAKNGGTSVMIGKDTRISGYMFESALEAGLIAAGIDVYLVGPMPTPAVAYLTQTFSCDMGIVISASHNPHCDNGIKFFTGEGKKISDQMEKEIESLLESSVSVVASADMGKAFRVDDAPGRYIEFCKGTYRAKKNLKGLRLVLDCANGATYHIAPNVFRELGAEVFTIGTEPNGMNINHECGATDTKALAHAVENHRADLGIAFDGDGDRVMMIDAKGREIDGDIILYILATMTGKPVPGVVGTVMSNLGFEQTLKAKGIEFARTAVGDRNVMEALVDKGWFYGSEPSGHVLCLNKIGTGDGIVAALQVLAALISQQRSLDQVRDEVQVYPQVLRNVTIAKRSKVEDNAALQSAVDAAELELDGKGRILIRASGTEPKIRVMVEGEDAKLVERIALELEQVVKAEFS